MSDVITTEYINGYRLVVVFDSARHGLYKYAVWLDVPYEVRPMPCYIGEHIFDGEPTRKQLERFAQSEIRTLQATLTALVKALPDAESVKNGVHEL